MTIETPRLIMREYTDDDFTALCEVLCDADIMRHYPYVFDEARVRDWISCNLERYADYGFGLWAVVLKETGGVIGDCGVSMQEHQRQNKARDRLSHCAAVSAQGLCDRGGTRLSRLRV